MAFGFSPKYNGNISTDGLTNKESLITALDTAKKLNWNLGVIGKNSFTAYSKFSMSSWSEEIQIKIEDGSISIKSECAGNQFMDWGKNKKNVNLFIETFDELRKNISTELINEKYTELENKWSIKSEDAIDHQPLAQKEKTTGLSLFIPSEGYFFTPILINLNIIVFALMVFSGVNAMLPTAEHLLQWGANFRPSTLGGEWWRLVTSCFLHIGIFHLLMNMYALMYIGLLLEPILGKSRFISAYLLTGIAGSVASLYWNEFTVSAGASGAIFGMYGVFLALLTTKIIEKSARKTLLTSIGIFVAYNLINGVKGEIDNAAHIGGLVSGLIIGYVYYWSITKPNVPNLKTGTIAVMTVLVLAASLVVLKTTEDGDAVKFDKEMVEFGKLEEEALSAFNLPEGTDYVEAAGRIQEIGMPKWEACLRSIDRTLKLDVPEKFLNRSVKLRIYVELRIKYSKSLYRYYTEEDNEYYRLQAEGYNDDVQRVIDDLSNDN